MLLNCGVEKILESPLDNKETQLVNPKGNHDGAPGKSGLHASGEEERVTAPEPW